MSPGVLAAFLVASTAAAPAEKAGTWVELRSPTFVLLTDAGAKAARRTIVRFEKIRAAFSVVLPSAELSGERELLVVAARNEKSLRSLVPRWWESKDGMRPSTVHLTGRDHVFILVRTDLREDDDESYHAAHWGYAAHLIGLNVPQLPLWALRGFADFYARTTVQKDRVVVGRAAVSHVRVLRERGLMPVTTLFAVDRQSPDYVDRARLRRFDAEAWALVHYLMLGEKGAHRPELGRFFWLLGEGRPAEDAAREAFGDTEALDKALATYVQSRAFYKEAIPADLETGPGTTTERPLSSAEGLTLRAAVHLASERYPDAHACLEEAIRLDPALAWAYEIRAATAWAQDDPIVAREAVEEALRLDPDRALARRLQGRLAGPPTVKGAERLCDAGDLAACTTLGSWLIDGNTTTPDPARGVSQLDRACTQGHTDACRQLSWRYRQGKGVTLDAAASVTYLEKGCTAGDGQACLAAASDYRGGGGGTADPTAAVRMLESACTQGETTGCLTLAWALQAGEDVPRDLERAAALYHDACYAGDGPSCTRLGLLYLIEDGLPTDYDRAREFLTRACGHGDQLGCSNLESLNAATTVPGASSPPGR